MKAKIFLLSILILCISSSCHVGRTIIWNFGNYDDYKKFDHEVIKKSETPKSFALKSEQVNTLLKTDSTTADFMINDNLEEFLTKNHTTSFLVLQRDSIIYNNYFNGHQEEELHCINSVSKSFLSLLIGIAVEEGKIKSIQDPIRDYIPELENPDLGAITIEELLDMESGIKYSELYYNPFGNLAKSYYGTDLRKYIQQLKIKEAPGNFDYISINTDILGWVLENAVQQSVPTYLEEKVWQPLGMEYTATWSLDSKKNKVPKFSYGLNTRAKDLLKLGYLYLKQGMYQETRVVSEEWVTLIGQIELDQKNQPNYKNHWWREVAYKEQLKPEEQVRKLDTYEYLNENNVKVIGHKIYTQNYYAAGFLGQFIYVCPEKEMVIVRTGKKQGKVDWVRLFRLISEQNTL